MESAPLFSLFAPLVIVLGGGLLALATEAFLHGEAKHRWLPWIVVVTMVAAAIVQVFAPTGHAFGMFANDPARRWLALAVIGAAACAMGGLQQTLHRDRFPGGESYALAAIATAGVLGMVMALDTIAFFVSVETAALAIYALVGLRRHRSESNEAILKYFVMGAIFSGVFLYGAALHYGATGSTRFCAAIVGDRQQLELIGAALMAAGMLFKVGSVPFHAWAPDAYTGAPVAVTGLMGAIIKVGGFAGLGTLWLGIAAGDGSKVALDAMVVPTATARHILEPLGVLIAVSAILSMVVGNFGALKQTSVRRLIGYSAIAHAGYMSLSFILPGVGDGIDLRPLWLYAVGYALATAGALTAIAAMSGNDDLGDDIQSLHGRGRQLPLYGLGLTVFLASFAGLPPTLGFLGKFSVLQQVVAHGGWLIALVGLIAAIAGAGAYLRLAVQLWAGQPKDVQPAGYQTLTRWGVACAAVLVVALTVVPRPLTAHGKAAAALPQPAPPADVR
ncbi:MAG: NADH-quinone oxidoreductase subunit N [Planctomycetota bacterium]